MVSRAGGGGYIEHHYIAWHLHNAVFHEGWSVMRGFAVLEKREAWLHSVLLAETEIGKIVPSGRHGINDISKCLIGKYCW